MSGKVPVYADQELDKITNADPPTTLVAPQLGFRAEDYRLWRMRDSGHIPCRNCDRVHEYLTHGCAPIAWPLGIESPAWCEMFKVSVATYRNLGAIPMPISMSCPLQESASRNGAHEHMEFRWL